jgi:hypothetical protein
VYRGTDDHISLSHDTGVRVTLRPGRTNCLLSSHSQSQKLLYDWCFTSNQFFLVTSPLRLGTRIVIFQLNTCGYNPYVTSSLTRIWVSRLQFMLPLASAVILRSESCETHDPIHCLRFEARFPYLYSPGTGWSGYNPRPWVPFSSPPTTRRQRWRYSTRPPHGILCLLFFVLHTEHLIRHGPQRKHRVQQFFYCCMCILYRGNLFTEPLPSNDKEGYTDSKMIS